jgi:NifU-like protein
VNVLTKHFFNPRNVGEASEPSFTGRAASLECGATLRLSLSLDPSQHIEEAKFKAAGCSTLVASLSILTEQVKGKTTAEAATLGHQAESLRELVGCVEAARTHCPSLACEALIAAVREYSDAARNEWAGDEALICTCFGVSEQTIEREIQAHGLRTIAEVTKACNAGAGCGSCCQLIEEILQSVG